MHKKKQTKERFQVIMLMGLSIFFFRQSPIRLITARGSGLY